jgi:hypothetical protein
MNELDLIKRFRADVPEPSTDAWLRARAAIAAARAETFESPAQVAPVRRGSPRHRRRLAVLALGITVVIATVGVTLALTKHGPNAPVARSDSSSRTTVRSRAGAIRARVVDALGGETGTILYTQSSMQVAGQPTSNGESWDYPWNGLPGQIVRQAGSGSVGGAVQNKWSLTFTVPSGGATSNSAPTTPPGATCNVSGQRIDVDFTDQTWQTSEQSCVALTPGLDAPAAFVDPMTHQLISNIKTLVADGLVHVVGYPNLNGEQTVELNSNTPGVTTLDLWVSARTYLPLQSVTTGPTGDPNPGKTWTEVDQYSFLSPTQANLANLQVTVPPGFREIVNAPKG